MFCPSCGGEFEADVTTCPDCGETLVDQLPPEPEHPRVVVIGHVSDPEVLPILHSMLDASGVPYTNYAPSWHVCPGVQAWRDHTATFNARRTERRVEIITADDPVGRRIRFDRPVNQAEDPWFTVVGVVGDVKQANLTEGARPGGVIMLHDGGGFGGKEDRTPTVDALPRIISRLKDRGLRFRRLDELIEREPYAASR